MDINFFSSLITGTIRKFGGLAARPTQVSAASGGPVIVSTSPSTGASNVPVNAKLILTFDENVLKGSGPATIYIRRLTDNVLFESYVVASDSR